ncbi:Lacal_2735 family protein [Psychroserpens mesophilus]|uniref:Lacal_2735 family protein n=1 Tax=Psychroserpens mesophilus TaxID=325473 RepID=UPI003D64F1F3
MFGLFKKTSEVDKLQKKYEKLMKEWHALSTTNRSESDKKYAEAEMIQKQIEQLQN